MAKKSKGQRNESITIPDVAMADLDIEAEKARAAADLKREQAKRKRDTAKTAEIGSCTTCRTPDWKSANGTRCYTRRIDLDPAQPFVNCEYWRAPLPN